MDDQTRIAVKQDLLRWLNSAPTEDRVSSFDNESVVVATAQNVREDNQDRAFFATFESPHIEKEFSLLAVLDGMGGMLDGGICANLGIASILANLISLPRAKNRLVLIEALNIANSDIFSRYSGRGGTTFAGLFIDHQGAKSVNVGDSRVYRIDPNGSLNRLSSDDRLGEQFARIKGLEHVALDPSIAERLGQHLGMSAAVRPNVRLIEDSTLRNSNGFIFVSTDGAHASGDEFILSTFRKEKNPKDAAEKIIESSRSNSTGDNATLICAELNSLKRSNHCTSSRFEKLTVWSAQGFFTFVMEAKPAILNPVGRSSKSRSLKKGKKNQFHERPPKTLPPNQSKVSTDKVTEEKKPAPKVIIEQLTFDPLKADEAPQ